MWTAIIQHSMWMAIECTIEYKVTLWFDGGNLAHEY